MNNNALQYALEYARRGWYVFPCREKDSEPFWDDKIKCERVMGAKSPYTHSGFMEATVDELKIKEWWMQYPEAAIGISCGHSNLAVIDIDIEDGKSGFDSFMTLNVVDTGALHSLTPSGGMHIVFSGQTDSHAYHDIKIDIRSVGAYIVSPNSEILVNGSIKKYVAIDDWTRTPSTLPSNLIDKFDLLRGKDKKNNGKKYKGKESIEELLPRIWKALKKLPQNFCDDRFLWVSIGLALKSVGEEAYPLWDKWSMKSEKYHKEKNLYVWNNMKPKEITIASLFYYAKEFGE